MRKFLVFLLSASTSLTASAQAVFVKRSDLWAYTMGSELGRGVAQAAEIRQHMGQREARYRQLADLRQRVQQCGSCAERDQLAAQAKQFEQQLMEEDSMLCGTFMAMEDLHPGSETIPVMRKLLGVAPVCDKLYQEQQKKIADARYKELRQQYVPRMKAGDVAAYGFMGQRTMTTFSHLSFVEQQSLACPYWYVGARKGDVFSITSLSQLCLTKSSNEADRKHGFELVKGCAAKGEARCIHELGWFYASTRNPNSWSPFPVDDREALRLWDLAAEKGMTAAKADATALRAKLQNVKATPDAPR